MFDDPRTEGLKMTWFRPDLVFCFHVLGPHCYSIPLTDPNHTMWVYLSVNFSLHDQDVPLHCIGSSRVHVCHVEDTSL